jgi:hypothetical protein
MEPVRLIEEIDPGSETSLKSLKMVESGQRLANIHFVSIWGSCDCGCGESTDVSEEHAASVFRVEV